MASSKTMAIREAPDAAPVEASKKRKSSKRDANDQPTKKRKAEKTAKESADDADEENANEDEGAVKKARKEEKKRKRKEEAEAQTEAPEKEEAEEETSAGDVDKAAAKVAAKAARKEEKRRAKEEKRKAKVEAAEGNDEAAEGGKEEEQEEVKEKSKPKEKKDKKKSKKAKTGEVEAEGADDKAEVQGAAGDGSSSSSATYYTQANVLSALPQADIDAFLAKEMVTVTDPLGKPASDFRPILDFAHIPQTPLLAKKPFGAFKAPTPIQAASWPYTLSGRDVIGVAETGSGKTMAFALPCVEAVVRAGAGANVGYKKKKPVRAVVVSPTRELAMQTHEQMAGLASLVGLECVCIYGGASKDAQRVQLRRADIVVATPGRLKDFMSDGTADLSSAAFVVLDEADRMLDKGFEEDIKLILGATPARELRQTLMFTATWPDSVQMLAATFMVKPVKLTIGSASRETTSGAVELQANSRITQRVEVVDPYGKEGRVLQIIRQRQQQGSTSDRILVFCLYKKEATRIEAFLAGKGVKVGGIHGDLRQEQRTRSLEAFKSGQTPVLVATDVAARGLDIPEVKLVLNVTFPLTIEDYVHRIGRTGRAGKTGEAITLFTVQDKTHSGSLINVLRSANQPVPEELLKFGTTVKKKTHPIYGAFFREQNADAKTQAKITFDD